MEMKDAGLIQSFIYVYVCVCFSLLLIVKLPSTVTALSEALRRILFPARVNTAFRGLATVLFIFFFLSTKK